MASEFWEVIDRARAKGKSCADFARALERILSELPPAEIEAFARDQETLMNTSYRWGLWGAAYVIKSGCSDDGFDHFRGWLMMQGRSVWDEALRDAESLAEVSFEGNAECEAALHAASKAYGQVTGRSLPLTAEHRPEQPVGTAWRDEDLEALYPKLWERFGTGQGEAPASGSRDLWDWRMEAGMAKLASGAFEEAARRFGLVREQAPRQLTRTIATNNLAWTDLVLDTPEAVTEALGLATEALGAIGTEPLKALYIDSIKATLAFALIKNDDQRVGLALIEEVLANESPGKRSFALRLCIRAIGLARTGDLVGARSLIRQARKADPQCQLLNQAVREVTGPTIVVPQELQGLAPLVQRFGISDDVERESALKGATTEELIALVNIVNTEMFDQITQFLDQTFDAEDAVPFGDLAQAAMEAKFELELRGASGV